MDSILASHRRSALGRLGETLAAEALRSSGFQKVRNLNDETHNHRFADLFAELQGQKYFIAVKARNWLQSNGQRNPSYNLLLVDQHKNAGLRAQGKTTDEITRVALEEVDRLANGAIPAWITVPIRPRQGAQGTYAVYFGLVKELVEKWGIRRSIPMTDKALKDHDCLVDWVADPRVTWDLSNQE